MRKLRKGLRAGASINRITEHRFIAANLTADVIRGSAARDWHNVLLCTVSAPPTHLCVMATAPVDMQHATPMPAQYYFFSQILHVMSGVAISFFVNALACCKDSVECSVNALHAVQQAFQNILDQYAATDTSAIKEVAALGRNVGTCCVALQATLNQLRMACAHSEPANVEVVPSGYGSEECTCKCPACERLLVNFQQQSISLQVMRRELAVARQQHERTKQQLRDTIGLLQSQKHTGETSSCSQCLIRQSLSAPSSLFLAFDSAAEDDRDERLDDSEIRRVNVGDLGSTMKNVMEFNTDAPSADVGRDKTASPTHQDLCSSSSVGQAWRRGSVDSAPVGPSSWGVSAPAHPAKTPGASTPFIARKNSGKGHNPLPALAPSHPLRTPNPTHWAFPIAGPSTSTAMSASADVPATPPEGPPGHTGGPAEGVSRVLSSAGLDKLRGRRRSMSSGRGPDVQPRGTAESAG